MPTTPPNEEIGRAARALLDELQAKADAHRRSAGVTPEETDALYDEAVRVARQSRHM